MAESKGIARLMQKQAGRAKEKLLQNLGKADRTTDEFFEEHLKNFNQQQIHANKLHKDISNYIRCIKAMQTASHNLMETLGEVYESEWVGHDLLYVQAQNQDMLWADLAHKLSDQVLIPLNTYQGQFPDMRKKIDKRGRKLIDYDKERHATQTMQASSNRNEAKFARQKEAMESAKRTYEILNSELHDELPALYDSRVLFLVTNMQTLFAAEEVFHNETAKVYSELEAIVDKLAKEVQRGTLPRKVLPKPLPLQSPTSLNTSSNSGSSPTKGECSENDVKKSKVLDNSTESNPESNESGKLEIDEMETREENKEQKDENTTAEHSRDPLAQGSQVEDDSDACIDFTAEEESYSSTSSNDEAENNVRTELKVPERPKRHQNHVPEDKEAPEADDQLNGNRSSGDSMNRFQQQQKEDYHNLAAETNGRYKRDGSPTQENYDIPVGATTDNLPPGVLYKVKASYKYQAEDVDELQFEVGEIIQVVPYEDPEEQEEGWLTGIMESTGKKGLFPANFTRPI